MKLSRLETKTNLEPRTSLAINYDLQLYQRLKLVPNGVLLFLGNLDKMWRDTPHSLLAVPGECPLGSAGGSGFSLFWNCSILIRPGLHSRVCVICFGWKHSQVPANPNRQNEGLFPGIANVSLDRTRTHGNTHTQWTQCMRVSCNLPRKNVSQIQTDGKQTQREGSRSLTFSLIRTNTKMIHC